MLHGFTCYMRHFTWVHPPWRLWSAVSKFPWVLLPIWLCTLPTLGISRHHVPLWLHSGDMCGVAMLQPVLILYFFASCSICSFFISYSLSSFSFSLSLPLLPFPWSLLLCRSSAPVSLWQHYTWCHIMFEAWILQLSTTKFSQNQNVLFALLHSYKKLISYILPQLGYTSILP